MALGMKEDHTIIVELGPLRPMSDVLGRHVLRLNNSKERRQDFKQRLITAGCAVNDQGTDWLNTGDFEGSVPKGCAVEGQAIEPDLQRALDNLDGLSAHERFRIALALCRKTQTIEFGRADSTGPTLVHKGFLERIECETAATFMGVPFMIPTPLWKHLQQIREQFIKNAREANRERQSVLDQLVDS
jgi:hypothetical protein